MWLFFFYFFQKNKNIEAYFGQKFNNIKNAKILKTDFCWFLQKKV